MTKQLIWSKDSISANKTMDDSLDLLFCQNVKNACTFKKMVMKERSISGLIKLLKQAW